MVFRVRLRERGRCLEFTTAHRVLQAHDAKSALADIERAESALREGYWIAGYLTYELGGAFVSEPVRGTGPLLRLGIFDPPVEVRSEAAAASLSPLVPRIDAATYARSIDAILKHIYDGDVYQVNYTVPFDLHMSGSPLALWDAIGERTAAHYQAFVEHDDGYVLSWSPELFLRFDGARLTTKPMKGTAPGTAPDALAGAKNRAEHIMIVDLLRNDLHRICNDVDVEALCTIERYPHFVTMTSTIAGTLRPHTPLRDIFAATFPCGSITGAPKRAAFATIAGLEHAPRGAYCGAIGFLSPERNGWWNVAIRTAQIERDGTGRYDAGGGIVTDSKATDEWNEVLLKTAFLDEVAQPLELRETLASDASQETIDAHLARLAFSAAQFRVDFDAAALEKTLHHTMAQAGHRSLVRLRLQRDGTFSIRTEPLITPPLPVSVCLTSQRVRSGDVFLRYKSAWRPAANAAFDEAQERGCFDGLMRNERGELTEGTRTNLFVEIDGTMYTPPVECGLLPGILRSRIVSEGRARERVLMPDDLARASAIFVGNSARGLLQARLV